MKKVNWKLLLIIACIKAIGFIFLVSLNKSYHPEVFKGIAVYQGDTGSYIEPIDNYINSGYFGFDSRENYIYRSPYYGVFYYSFRQILSPFNSLQALVLFQLLIEIVAFYCFSLVALSFLRRKYTKFLFLFLIGVSLYHADYTYRILTESLSLSFLFFSFYFFYKFSVSRSAKLLFLSGCFFGYLVLLKPYFGLYYLFFGISFILLTKAKGPIVKRVKKVGYYCILVFIPFLLFDSPWIIRNYVKSNKFQPFIEQGHSELTLTYRKFVTARGESYVRWDHQSAGCYFEVTNQPCNFVIKESFTSANSSEQDIQKLRDDFLRYQNSSKDSVEELRLTREFQRLTENYKKDKPLDYHLLSRARIVYAFVVNSGSHYLPYSFSSTGVILKLIKLSQSFLYYLALAGMVGLLLLYRRKRELIVLWAIPIYLLVLFPMFFLKTEWRYFFHFYPFGILGLCFLTELILEKLKSRKV